MHRQPAAAAFQRQFDGFQRAHLFGTGHAKPISHDIQYLAAAVHTLALHARKATGRQPLFLLLGRGVGGQLNGEGQHQPRVTRCSRTHQQIGINGLWRVVPHRQRSLAVEQLRRTRPQQLQVVVQFGHRPHRRTRCAHRVGLVDGNGWRHAVDAVHRRAVHAVQKLARIGAEGFDVAALAFGVQRVEDQRRLAAAAGPGNHRQFARANVQVQILQVVLARTADADQAFAAMV